MPFAAPPPPGTPLTDLERRVLTGIACGHNQHQITADLRCNAHQYRAHLVSIGARLQCPARRLEIVVTAYRTGVLRPLPPDLRSTLALTPEQLDLLRQLAAGDSLSLIGRRLGVTERTVLRWIRVINALIGATGRTHAVALALHHGHITAPPLATTHAVATAA